MDDDIGSLRAELNRLYDELEELERFQTDPDLVRQYRALTRQLADKISDLEQARDGEPSPS